MTEPKLAVRAGSLLRSLFFLARNRISAAGVALTTGSALTMLGFWALEALSGRDVHPYAGIVLFLILPFAFVLGLLLIPLGVLLQRRRLRATGELPEQYPRIDFHLPEWRQRLALLALLTVAERRHPGRGLVQGRRVHGLDPVLRPDLPHGDGARVHGLLGLAARARGLRPVPHRARRLAGSCARSSRACGRCSRSPSTPTRGRSRRRWSTCGRRARPASSATGRRSSTATSSWCGPSTRTTRPTPRLTTVLVLKIGGRAARRRQGHPRPPPRRRGRASSYVADRRRRQVIPQVTYVDDARQDGRVYDSAELKATPEQLAQASGARWTAWTATTGRPTPSSCPSARSTGPWPTGASAPSCPSSRRRRSSCCGPSTPTATAAGRGIAEGLTEYYRTQLPRRPTRATARWSRPRRSAWTPSTRGTSSRT